MSKVKRDNRLPLGNSFQRLGQKGAGFGGEKARKRQPAQVHPRNLGQGRPGDAHLHQPLCDPFGKKHPVQHPAKAPWIKLCPVGYPGALPQRLPIGAHLRRAVEDLRASHATGTEATQIQKRKFHVIPLSTACRLLAACSHPGRRAMKED